MYKHFPSLQLLCSCSWQCFGDILALCCQCLGNALRMFWQLFGDVLPGCWLYVRNARALCRRCVGKVLAMFRQCFGNALLMLWHFWRWVAWVLAICLQCLGYVSAMCCWCLGNVSAMCWQCVGEDLVMCWSRSALRICISVIAYHMRTCCMFAAHRRCADIVVVMLLRYVGNLSASLIDAPC